jgi:hypothetical protein
MTKGFKQIFCMYVVALTRREKLQSATRKKNIFKTKIFYNSELPGHICQQCLGV